MKVSEEFPAALNLDCKVIEVRVLKWAWDAGLFESPAELERCRLQKINWFAAYLFPEEHSERLELIMKFFICLFLLDDLLDIAIDSAILEFLEGLKTGNPTHPNNRLHSLGLELIFLCQLIEDENEDDFARGHWHTAWLDYLDALQWEIQIKLDGIAPHLQDYRIMRPKSSGVYLAILLIRKGKDLRDCISELLEFSLARYICLSNDLASYKKELAIGDPNNELVILMETMGDTALFWAQQEVKQLRKRVLDLASQVCASFTNCEEWIRKLLLLAGGCEAWTAETLRYQKYINGNIARH